MKIGFKKLAAVAAGFALVAAMGLSGCGSSEHPAVVTGDMGDWSVDVELSDDSKSVTVRLDQPAPEDWQYQIEGETGIVDLLTGPEVADGVWAASFSTAGLEKDGMVTLDFTQRYVAGAQELAHEYALTLDVSKGEISLYSGDGYNYPAEFYFMDGDMLVFNMPLDATYSWGFQVGDEKILEAVAGPDDDGDVTAVSYRGIAEGDTDVLVQMLDQDGKVVSYGDMLVHVGSTGEITLGEFNWVLH